MADQDEKKSKAYKELEETFQASMDAVSGRVQLTLTQVISSVRFGGLPDDKIMASHAKLITELTIQYMQLADGLANYCPHQALFNLNYMVNDSYINLDEHLAVRDAIKEKAEAEAEGTPTQ